MALKIRSSTHLLLAVTALLLATLLLTRSEPVGAQSLAPDLQTYASWVRESLAAARRGDRIGLEETGQRLINTTQVQIPNSGSISVDNSWLRDELAHQPPDTTRIAERLGALADALAQPPNAAPSDALNRLQAIHAAPPYSRPKPTPPPAWLTDLLNWLGRIIEALLRPIGGIAPGTANVVAWAIGLIGLVALIGVIVYLIAGLRRGVIAEARPPDDDPEANLTARDALDQASTLAREGDYRTAVRFLYLAALLRLDERGLLRYDRALTNREYLERIGDNPKLQAALQPIVETFDNVWYGSTPLDPISFEAYRASVERLGRDV
jgi:hypothetical protein